MGTRMILRLMTVGVGGFAGAICRYLLSTWVQRASGWNTFPLGTVVVNLLGCLLIGLLGGLVITKELFSPAARLFLLTGLLGGFTTFSTFGYETLMLLRDANYGAACMNVGIQLVAGLIAVFFGIKLATIL
ncbi:MAG: fluoride efflux transporter CrcB [Spartobacteria bacterium]|nr:fluoride efflux transporter CrcB [Spartobacteria bacterium]